MVTLDDIKPVIGKELDEFELRFKDSMKSSVPLLDKITYYLIKRRGKQLRPMLVFLSAGLHGKMGDSSYRAAALIELLHTATLVHDDVVDETYRRRGFFSINALWKNKVAVLVGDYLLSRGLLLAVGNKEFQLLEIVSKAVQKMSEGELLQIEKTRKLNITEEEYYEIIACKTASLVAACCASGALSVGMNEETVQKMWTMGELIGMAFQLKDDLLDYGSGQDIGKPIGTDIKEKKMSLPLIFALQQSTYVEKKKIINLIKNKSQEPEVIEEIFNFVKLKGGLEYAKKTMIDYREKSKIMLNELPDSEYKKAFMDLIEFVTERKN
ncbi:MAG TPA: polyprenyl synthetase family protein [Bacteroidia bacterium]|nr:polyprenyl synthetase family protein [Bacteroidia bacterium]